MKPINTEITMVPNIGVVACYYRPTERNILGYYVKTVDPQFIQHIVKFTNRLPKKFARIIEKVEAMDFYNITIQHIYALHYRVDLLIKHKSK